MATALDSSIRLSWTEVSAGITGYVVRIATPLGAIVDRTLSASTKSIAVRFNGPLGNACDGASFKDGVTATVRALNKTGSSVTGVASQQMPRTAPPLPSPASVSSPADNQVQISGTFVCPLVKWGFVRSQPAAHTSSPGTLHTERLVTVDKGIYQTFSIQQCTLDGQCSALKQINGLSVAGKPYPLSELVGVCDPGGNFIQWSWNPGQEQAFNPTYSVVSAEGWTGDSTAPGIYTFKSSPPKSVSSNVGPHSVTVTPTTGGISGAAVTGQVSCAAIPMPPPTPTPRPTLS